jgi:hypothetical protein
MPYNSEFATRVANLLVVPISKVISKQKWSSDNLEDELQQPKKPQSDSFVVDSSPSSYGDECLLNNSLFRDVQSLVQYSLQQFSKIVSIAHKKPVYRVSRLTQRFDDIYDKKGVIIYSTIASISNESYFKCLDQSTFNGFMGEDNWRCARNSSQPGEGTSASSAFAPTRNKRDVAVSVLDKSQRLAETNKICKGNYSLLFLLQFH